MTDDLRELAAFLREHEKRCADGNLPFGAACYARWASAVEGAMKDAGRWNRYAASPQTALMLGSALDPNDAVVDWVAECNALADAITKDKP